MANVAAVSKGLNILLGLGDNDARWRIPLLVALFFGLATLAGFASTQENSRAAIAAALLAGGASLSTGAALGFLFGIPRVISEASHEPSVLDGKASYQVNTNLEQISDWLTKIIVGVGLIQMKELTTYFASVSESLAHAFGKPSVPTALAGAVLIYFGINGFLLCYLWTRLLLLQEFSRADLASRQSPEFYEGMIQAFLYQSPPDGFVNSLAATKEYQKRFGEGNWRLWRSVACANAQKYTYLRDSDKAAAQEAKKDALLALKRVLAINPGEKESMMNLWDPAQASPQEDDLVVFFDDPQFQVTFGRQVIVTQRAPDTHPQPDPQPEQNKTDPNP